MKAPYRQQGFSLLELMIGVIILSILVALAVPAFGDAIERRQIAGIIDDIQTRIALARSEAIKRNQPVSFAIQAAGGDNWCLGLKSNDTAGCDCTETVTTAADYCAVGDSSALMAGSDVAGITLDPAAMTAFDPNGDADNTFSFDPTQGTLSNLGDGDTTTGGNQLKFSSSDGNYLLEVSVNPLGLTKACFSSSPATPRRYGNLPTCS
jgi:type IV fimbrial biogenesis protein FimT